MGRTLRKEPKDDDKYSKVKKKLEDKEAQILKLKRIIKDLEAIIAQYRQEEMGEVKTEDYLKKIKEEREKRRKDKSEKKQQNKQPSKTPNKQQSTKPTSFAKDHRNPFAHNDTKRAELLAKYKSIVGEKHLEDDMSPVNDDDMKEKEKCNKDEE